MSAAPPAAGPRFTIRRAAPEDAVPLAGLAERTFRDTYAEHNTTEDMAGYIAAHFGVRQQTAELGDPARLTLLAEAGGAAAGYVQLGWGPAPGCVRGGAPMEVIRFYVDRVWHGHGLAQLLMAAAVGAARDAGAGVLWLGVWERNARAIAFYRKSGFEDVGAQTFVLGTDHQRDRVLARPLT